MNVFQLFTGSFHSAAAYRYMRTRATGGMGYMLFVVMLVTLFVLLWFGVPVYTITFQGHDGKPPLFDQSIHQIAERSPLMTLKGDTLVTKTPEKTVINITGTYGKEGYDVPVLTIDTTGTTSTSNATTPVLVTDKNLFIRSNEKWDMRPLSDFTKQGPETIIINHAVADEMATSFVAYIHDHLTGYFIILWLLAITCLFVVTFITLLILGLGGLLIGNIIHSPITYSAALSLAALSFTPVMILDTLLLAAGYAAHTSMLLMAGMVTNYAAIHCSDPKRNLPVAV